MKKTFWISERRSVPALRRVAGEIGTDFVNTGDNISAADPRVLASLIDQGHAEIRDVPDEPQEAPGGVAIPIVITRAMRKELRAAGHSEADIDKMTPEDASAALNPPT
jgi:hypothetical protein